MEVLVQMGNIQRSPFFCRDISVVSYPLNSCYLIYVVSWTPSIAMAYETMLIKRLYDSINENSHYEGYAP